jgi:hemerythrin-like domain-containing protein
MNKLISELQKEHLMITAFLDKIQNSGLFTPKTKELLSQSKSLILSHLAKEDNLLYPPLNTKAKSDEILDKTLTTYAKEMEKISEFILGFYQKYNSETIINKADFIKDLSELIITLRSRIMKEELVIYSEYEKLQID